MSEWAPKRFWTEVTVEGEGPFEARLDGRGLKTPLKSALALPTRAMAEAVAGEWRAVGELVDPRLMPVTRSANSAIDKVPPQREEVVAMLAEYGATDLLCYRATHPGALVDRQAETWDPLLDWAEARHGARLAVTRGVMPTPQDRGALRALRAPMDAMSDFELAAMHDLVALSGSLVVAHAVAEGHLAPGEAWEISRLDEAWQMEQWGDDDEALALNARKRGDFLHAHRFLGLARAGSPHADR